MSIKHNSLESKSMNAAAVTTLLYALLILAGGAIGHVQAKSLTSLIMGIVFGALLLGSAFTLFRKKEIGRWSSLILVVLLDAFFTYRFTLTHKFMPSGLFAIVSTLVLFLLAYQLRRSRAAAK